MQIASSMAAAWRWRFMAFFGRIKAELGSMAVLHFKEVVMHARHEFLTVILWAIRLDMPTADMKITRL